jgi:hypothetical protein
MARPIRVGAKGRKRWAIAAIAIAVICLLVACGLFRDPSARREHWYVRKDCTVVTCLEPPPDVAPAIRAEIDAEIADIVDALNASTGIEAKFARIRPTVPSLQAVEALEFRMCAAWAQGLLDERAYREFLTRILPLLRQTCPSEAPRKLKRSKGATERK